MGTTRCCRWERLALDWFQLIDDRRVSHASIQKDGLWRTYVEASNPPGDGFYETLEEAMKAVEECLGANGFDFEWWGASTCAEIDPNILLREMRILAKAAIGPNPDPEKARLLAEHFVAMDDHIRWGGALPEDWEEA